MTMKVSNSLMMLFTIFTLSSCGGGGGGSLSDGGGGGATSSNVSGVVVDGPIYGATVTIYAVSDTSFNTPLATTTTSSDANTIGSYNLSVENLPSEYVLKVSGGNDTGPDGVKNDNDESGFEMMAVANTNNSNTVYISPATTIEANLVVKNNLTITNAKAKTKQIFNLEDGFDFTTVNPKENEIAAKTGVLIAQMTNALPTGKEVAMQAISNIIKDKNTTTFSVKSNSVEIKDISLVDIASKVNELQANTIKDDDISKISKGSQTFMSIIENTVNKVKPTNIKNDVIAIASHKSMLKIKDLIYSENIETIDFDNLETRANNLENSLVDVLNTGVDSLDNDNLDIITEIVLDKGKVASSTIVAIANKTKKLTGDKKQLLKNIYKNTDDTKLSEVNNLDFNSLDSLVIEDSDDDFKEDMYKTIADNISNTINSTKTLDIADIASKTVNNPTLKNSIKTISNNKKSLKQKTNLTSDEKAQLRAEELALKNITENLNKNDKFDEVMAQNLATAKTQIEDKMKELYQNINDLQEQYVKIKALEIATKEQDLLNFDENDFVSEITKVNNLFGSFTNNIVENTDIYSSIDKIEDYFETEMENKNFDEVVNAVDNNIYDYIKTKQESFEMPYIPMPPTIDEYRFDI